MFILFICLTYLAILRFVNNKNLKCKLVLPSLTYFVFSLTNLYWIKSSEELLLIFLSIIIRENTLTDQLLSWFYLRISVWIFQSILIPIEINLLRTNFLSIQSRAVFLHSVLKKFTWTSVMKWTVWRYILICELQI